MRLRLRQTLRQLNRQQREDRYNPINLDYIFDEDDPLSPWLVETESPLLDNQDNPWLFDNEEEEDDDDDIQRGGLGGTGTTSETDPRVVPIRLHDDDDDDDGDDDGDGDGGDDDDDDDDDGPPGAGNVGGDTSTFIGSGEASDLHTDIGGGSGTNIYMRGLGTHRRISKSSDTHGTKGKGIQQQRGEEEYSTSQADSNLSTMHLHGHGSGYEHAHYPLSINDSSTDTSSSMNYDYGYGQQHYYPPHALVNYESNQLADSLFGGVGCDPMHNYFGQQSHGQYQQNEDQDHSSYQDPPRRSFWW